MPNALSAGGGYARAPLDAILLEPWTGRWRKRLFRAARKHWKSLAQGRGGKKILKLSWRGMGLDDPN